MDDLSTEHLLMNDREDLVMVLRGIRALIDIAEAKGSAEVVRWLEAAEREARRILADEGGALPN